MADAPITTNRTKKVKKEPRYNSIDEIPVNEFVKPTQHEVVEYKPEKPEVIQPAVLEINSVASLLQTNAPLGHYDIYFPTFGRSFRFKQITVGQQRSLSKNAADFKNRAEQMKLRCSLLKAICLDEGFDPLQISWAEYVNALIIVRNNNFIDELTYNIECDNEDCGTVSYPFTVDLESLSESLQNIIIESSKKEKTFEFEINGNKVVFYLEFPTMTNYILLAEQYKKETSIDSIDISAFLYPYIQKITINGSIVNIDPIKNNSKQFMEFIDNSFIGMSFKQFAEAITLHFENFTSAISSMQSVCPNCKTEKTLTFDLDDFFTL